MQAINRHVTKIINGTTQFVIPVFQRDYSWTDSQCAQLWADVLRIAKSDGDRGHFMGSLVYIPSGDNAAGLTRWLLIDGQQRMTTLMLLLIALRRHIQETGWLGPGEGAPTAKKIDAYFLKNMEEEGDRRYKLVLRRHDQAMFRALLDDAEPPKTGSPRILENYEFFKERMAEADPALVYAGIGRLVVVDVTLDRVHDDPQMIFESLNSTGLDLSQADLIRNFILMRVPEKAQTHLYESLWSKSDELFRGEAGTFDSFARDYMALHTQPSRQARADDIYHGFRAFFRERERALTTEEALADMLRFARYHAAFSLGRGAPSTLQAPLARLNRLAEVAAILVMRLYDLHDRAKTLAEAEFAEALALLESYVFRRAVLGLQTRGYWQTFATLAYRLDDKEPLTSLKVHLHRLRESARFPRDEEFEEALARRDLYNTRICHYMLDRLENHGSKEPTDTGGYTVEHVLPQNENLVKAWRDMLGDGWADVQRTWLHRLGNLTLTGYNSKYSDRPFEEKKSVQGGFEDSSIRLNKFIRQQSCWTAAEIETRGRQLAHAALDVWKGLVVSKDALRAAAQDDLRARAGRRSVDQLGMSADARLLFDALSPLVRGLGPGIIEVPEAHSVVYHAADGDYFLEILPRKHRLTLLLNLDPSECEYKDEHTVSMDTFLVNAVHEGGVVYNLIDAGQIESALRIVRQAHELAAQ